MGNDHSNKTTDTPPTVDAQVRREGSSQLSSAEAPALPARYKPLEKIAQGGMGAVWRVIDLQFDRALAAKVMLPAVANDANALFRFQREAQLTGSLQHPAIPPVVDRGALNDGSPFFTMKLVEGATLAERLAIRVDDDLLELLGVFEQICQAVGYAHAQGVIHRDLKPANIMIGEFGEVQVMDWGMAKLLIDHDESSASELSKVSNSVDHTPQPPPTGTSETIATTEEPETDAAHTQHGTVMGTLAYMPPEQARGEVANLSARSDVFALGAILIEILTGQRAYAGKDIWRQAVHGNLKPALARLNESGVDEELAMLCRSCLAVSPADRPPDGAAVAVAIRRYEANLQQRLEQERAKRAAAQARAEEEKKRQRVERSRRLALMALAALVGLVLFSAAAAGLWYRQDRSAQAAARAARSENAEREIENLLARAAIQRDAYDFETARELLSQAKARRAVLLSPGHVTKSIEQAERDLKVVETLTDIRERKSVFAGGDFKSEFARGENGDYAAAFRSYGIDVTTEPPAENVADLVSKSAVRQMLIAALDDWALDDRELRPRLLAVSRAAVTGAVAKQLRDPVVWEDRAALVEIAKESKSKLLPPFAAIILADRLVEVGEGAAGMGVLRLAAVRNPRNYWVNFNAASLLDEPPTLDREAAIGFYRNAIANRPTSYAAYNNLGVLLEGSQSFEEAEAVYRRAIEINSQTNSTAHHNLGNLLTTLDRLDEAEVSFRSALEIDPSDGKAQLNFGKMLFNGGRFEEAEVATLKAIKLEPNFAMAFNNLGLILEETDRPEKAEAAYRKALEIEPKNAAAYTYLGFLLHDADRFEEAEAAYRKVIELTPNDPDAHYNLGLLLEATGHSKQAESAYRKAIDLAPKDAEAHLDLANLMETNGRFNEAEAVYREAIKIYPENLPVLNDLGVLLERTNRYKEAEAVYRKAIDIDPDYVNAEFNLGLILKATKRFEAAVGVLRKVTELDPNHPHAHNSLGVVLKETNRFDEAEAAFRRAIEIDGESYMPYLNLGLMLLNQTERYSEAVPLLERGHTLGARQENWSHPSAAWVAQAKSLVAALKHYTDIQKGGSPPDDPAEVFALAVFLIVRKGNPAQAADLFASALADESLDESLRERYRHNAACAAARVAAGDVEAGAPCLSAEEREKWRTKALTWLREHLNNIRAKLTSPNSQTRQEAKDSLLELQVDTDLASLRGDALESLPPKQRVELHQFWTDLAQALEKVNQAKQPQRP